MLQRQSDVLHSELQPRRLSAASLIQCSAVQRFRDVNSAVEDLHASPPPASEDTGLLQLNAVHIPATVGPTNFRTSAFSHAPVK